MQIDALRVFPVLNTDAAIAELKEELPAYLVAAEDVQAHMETPESRVAAQTSTSQLGRRRQSWF